jgi:MazG family protein
MAPRKSQRKNSKHSTRAPRKSNSGRSSRVGPAFEELVAVMARLRAPGGCPWDREQTHSTLRTYLIEEAYEVLDALDSTDDAKFAEELGDLLLQVLFHAQIAHEEQRFDITTVIREIHEKMLRRHPHVFGEKRAKDAAEVLRNWEIIKQQERQSKSALRRGRSRERSARAQFEAANPASLSSLSSAPVSVLDGVPRALPALLEAYQLTRKAARIGFDWPDLDGIFAKLHEETGELQDALAERSGRSSSPASLTNAHSQAIESEVGDLLFVTVNLARFLNLDPELALKKTSAKFSSRFREMERLAREQGTTLAQVPRPQMESLWDQAKQREHSVEAPK